MKRCVICNRPREWCGAVCSVDHSQPASDAPRPATDAELDAIAAEYVAIMRARGVNIGLPEESMIRRAAGINDAWRLAFARCLK